MSQLLRRMRSRTPGPSSARMGSVVGSTYSPQRLPHGMRCHCLGCAHCGAARILPARQYHGTIVLSVASNFFHAKKGTGQPPRGFGKPPAERIRMGLFSLNARASLWSRFTTRACQLEVACSAHRPTRDAKTRTSCTAQLQRDVHCINLASTTSLVCKGLHN